MAGNSDPLKSCLIPVLAIAILLLGSGAVFGAGNVGRFNGLSEKLDTTGLFGSGSGSSADCALSIFDSKDEEAAGARAKKYMPFFEGAAKKFDVDLGLLVAVAKNEAGLSEDDPHKIVSKSGAIGVMQTLPGTFTETRTKDYGTARTKGKKADTNIDGKALPDDAGDAEAGIYAGAVYLAWILDQTPGGDIKLVAQKYNAGTGNPGAANMNYANSVAGDYDTVQKCEAKKPKSSTANNTAAKFPDPTTFALDKSYLFDDSKPNRQLSKWIQNIESFIKRRNYPAGTKPYMPMKWIVLHSTQSPDIPDSFKESVQTETEYKKQPGREGTQYYSPDNVPQFVVKGKTVYQFLPPNVISHTTSRFNHVSINIEIVGYADEKDGGISADALKTTAELVKWLMKNANIDQSHIISHEDVGLVSQGMTGVRKDVNYAAIKQDYNWNDDTKTSNGDPSPKSYGKEDPGDDHMQDILDRIDGKK